MRCKTYSSFKWSPGCASSGDAPHMAPLHPHGHRDRRRFACIFCRVDLIVCHGYKLKTMLWLIKSKYELPMLFSLVFLSTYSYIIWAPAIDDGFRFGHHFLMACELFVEKTSISRIKLISLLFYHFILNQATAFLSNPFRRGCPRPIGLIQRFHVVGGANGTTMVVMFVG
jgi:hypothetical protein